MAQAARQNLRMQKELKLLLTDPPPGASFPTLSAASDLTSIDALFRGPEGTVYADGVFKIKFQIPERYPFQPPIVTFATPIYHPNIDTGGRICLDILNLPPKGTWQPSLNISTVLTSIGLLLSEPNPDDGLMHEASRDYKYNRQAFDQTARSMAEKYARVGENESASCSHGGETHTAPTAVQIETKGSDATIGVTEQVVHRERLSVSSRKLSLGSCSNEVSTHDHSQNDTVNGKLKEPNNGSTKQDGIPANLDTKRNKLSLRVSVGSHNGNGEKENVCPPNNCSLQQTTSTNPEDQKLSYCANKMINPLGPHLKFLHVTNDVMPDEKRQSNQSRDWELTDKSHMPEDVVVLDSEDSEDENVPVRSKLSLAKRPLLKKTKRVC